MPLTYNIAFTLRSEGVISAISFSPDGLYLAAVNTKGGVHIVQTSSGASILSLKRHNSAIFSLLWTSIMHKEFTFGDSRGFIITATASDEVITFSSPHVVDHIVYIALAPV